MTFTDYNPFHKEAWQQRSQRDKELLDKLKKWLNPETVAGDRSINYMWVAVAIVGLIFIIYKLRSK